MQLLGQQFPWVLRGAIDFNGTFMCSSSEFSEGSFKVIIYGKLLQFSDIYSLSTERRPPTYECTLAKILLAMSTVNGTLQAHCILLNYHSIFGAAFYI